MSMAQPVAPQPLAAPAKSGVGCGCFLRGCLILILALVVLFVVGVIAFQFIGKPYIASQIPVWRKENPYLGILIDTFGIGSDFAQNPAQLASGRKPGATTKSALPADIPVYPTPVGEAYSIDSDQVTAYQRVSGPSQPVAGYFRDAMPKNGWNLENEMTAGDTTRLSWTKDQRACLTEIVDRDGDTEVWLRCGQAAQTKPAN